MAQQVTLGGERLGSGNKVTQELYNYGMNSFNQGRNWRSTMAAGLLYPCFKEIGTNHGTFDIDIDTIVRTLPTKGPLFGSFKMQVDLFNVPFRLYQGILHNNPVDIGLHMNQVYLPVMRYRTIDGKTAPRVQGSTPDDEQVSTNSLIKYLGISGAGHQANWGNIDTGVQRLFQCVPELGYYDIFKNYYSNKQEEKAFVVTPVDYPEEETAGVVRVGLGYFDEDNVQQIKWYDTTLNLQENIYWNDNATYQLEMVIWAKEAKWDLIQMYNADSDERLTIQEGLDNGYFNVIEEGTVDAIAFPQYQGYKYIRVRNNGDSIKGWMEDSGSNTYLLFLQNVPTEEYTSDIYLREFSLKNIDKMRSKLLSNNELSDVVTIDAAAQDRKNVWGYDSGSDQTGLPYIACLKQTTKGISWAAFNQTGLVTKTYQSDMFNNWLDNSLVDTIAQRTKIDTTSGGFTPDTLILQEKIYKYLNRILVSGGTYYDWQEATYGEGVARMCEIPMYIGGMSTEIMFEEVIANNESKTDGKYQALGALAGKGTQTGKKGGNNIHVRMDEPGYIIGIVSITPRISVFQGNDWDRTELLTMDDLHKPELDGIGFQDLMVENMAWWNTVISPGSDSIVHRDAVGKQTAWLHYQTAVDKVYGDFAKNDGYSFMVLSRQYEHDESNVFGVKDLTTYIDPAKYNYAFAYQDLAAQNFWVHIAFKCVSRRKMGAQQLPTL